MVKENDSHNKMKGLTSFIVVLFLLSIVISSQNSHLVNIVYADDNHDGIKNESLINDISDKIVNPSNNKDALQQILQLIQSQIAQTSGPNKATKVLNLIDSIVKLNPRGQLSQSLQYLAKEQTLGGNTQSVQQAVSQITQFVSNGGDNIGQPLGRQQVETLLSPALPEQLPSKASLSNTSIQPPPPPPPPPQPQPQPIEQLTLPQATPSQSYNITSGVRESNTPLPNQQVHSLQQQNLVQPTPTNNDLQLRSNVANDMCTSLPINTITVMVMMVPTNL